THLSTRAKRVPPPPRERSECLPLPASEASGEGLGEGPHAAHLPFRLPEAGDHIHAGRRPLRSTTTTADPGRRILPCRTSRVRRVLNRGPGRARGGCAA